LKGLAEAARHTRRTLAMVWRSSPKLTFSLGALTIIAAALPPSIAWAGKRIVDAVVAASTSNALTWVGVELALVAVQATVSRGLSLTTSTLGSRLGTDINVEILERATRLELRHFEDSEFYDKMSRAPGSPR
jgi:ATP-binding cassette subfamily B protein